MSHPVTDVVRPTTIEAPQEPALARAWQLAVAKFEAEHLRVPSTREDWRAVTREHSRLVRKIAGSIAQVIAQRCAEAPGGD